MQVFLSLRALCLDSSTIRLVTVLLLVVAPTVCEHLYAYMIVGVNSIQKSSESIQVL